jgi:GntR family transcriptional regulator
LTTEPKYRQIAAELRAAIGAGDYKPGDRLPGENELMARYEIARMTARQALGVLLNEGVAVARKGSGVFVRDFTPIIREALTRLSHDRWARGASIWSADADGRPIHVDTRAHETTVPERIAPLLGLTEGQTVCVRERRFTLDDHAIMLSTSYLPAASSAAPRSPKRTPAPAAPTPASPNPATNPPASAKTFARMPQPEESAALDLPATGTPVIDITRTAFTQAGEPIEVNEMTLDASAYILRYDFNA